MNTYLLYKNKDFDSNTTLVWNAGDLIQDLGLSILFNTMSDGNELVHEVAEKTILNSVPIDVETIIYRQQILHDCLNNPTEIKDIYTIAEDAIESRQKGWFGVFSSHPSSVLYGSSELVLLYLDALKKLVDMAHQNSSKFQSEGFKRFFKMIVNELTIPYFEEVELQLKQLRLRGNLVMSAQLGKGNIGMNYTLHQPQEEKITWWQKIFGKKVQGYTFYIHPRDESGARALRELRDRGLNDVANALAQSSDHIMTFFKLLQAELSFYRGCVNLQEQLFRLGCTVSLPEVVPQGEKWLEYKELYDPCLALSLNKKIVGNDVDSSVKNPVIITGANQGGKSTFLRSIGIAQLMMQSGMFVPAQQSLLSISSGIFIHFKREEDATMKRGKFDEELSRMSEIAERIKPGALVLFNEAFGSTNEIEGAEIAMQIVTALVEENIHVFFVTHLYDFAANFYRRENVQTLFLRAERKADASRTFKVVEGKPLETSYGQDLYYRIFKEDNTNPNLKKNETP